MMTIRFFVRVVLFVSSAVLGAGLFVLAWSHGTDLGLSSASTGSIIGASAPLIGIALAFPAIYLLWEQSEM